MYLISGMYWDKGERESNQDSLILEQVLTKRGRVVLAAVCDGIGGLTRGEVASGFACEKLKEYFYRELLPMVMKGRSRRAIGKCFCRCLYESSEGLKKYAKEEPIGLGTTVSAVFLWKKHYATVHLGDSRIYQIRRKKIRQLTVDHKQGKNRLTKCLSSFPYQMPDIRYGRVRNRTGFLLCSDGFYHFPEKELLKSLLSPAEINSESAISKRLRELAVYGMKRGEKDNMAAIYLLCCRGLFDERGKKKPYGRDDFK